MSQKELLPSKATLFQLMPTFDPNYIIICNARKVSISTESCSTDFIQAAMKAYQRDLAVQVGLVPQEEVKPQRKVAPQKQQAPQKSKQKSKFSKPEASTIKASSTTMASVPPPPPPAGPPPSLWQQLATPEGYIYYYNSQTGGMLISYTAIIVSL